MSIIFLSYGHADAVTAAALREELTARGYRTVFRDHDARVGIPAGALWARELFNNLERADIVVYLGTRDSLISPWCHTELAVAVARGRYVVQVGLEAVATHPVLRDRQRLAPEPNLVALVDSLVRDLSRVGFPPADSFDWDPGRSPYPGLRRLDTEHAAVLFGRDHEIGAIVERLAQPRAAPVLVVGPSGSGKSSLVRAGVLPRLAPQDGTFVLPVVEPGSNPLHRVAAAFATVEPKLDLDRLVGDPGAFRDAVDQMVARGGRVLLVLDQVEDALAGANRSQLAELVSRLSAVDRQRLAVVVVLRSASLEAWMRDPGLTEFTPGDPLWVRPLNRSDLREVIVGPARLAGIQFQPAELVERILDDTGDGRALPLLAALLEELTRNHSRVSPALITVERYETVGPVRRIVERRAAAATAELRTEQGLGEPAVVEIFLRLVDIDPSGQVTRSELVVSTLPDELVEVFATLERHRLVIRDRRAVAPEAAPASAGQSKYPATDLPTAEAITPVHEEVFRAWPALAAAIDDQRYDLEIHSWLRRDAEAWRSTGEGNVALTGGRLDRALDWWERHQHQAEDDIGRYVKAAARQRRRRRGLAIAAPVLAASVLVVGMLSIQLAHQAHTADRARSNAEALRLAGESRDAIATRPDLALQLSLEALARGNDVQVQAAPFVALTRGPGPRGYQQLPTPVEAAALDGAGTRAVLVTASGTLLWDVAAARVIASLPGSTSVVAMSGDGSTLARAAGSRIEIRGWQASVASSSCPVPSANVEILRLSPRGDTLLVVAVDRTRVPAQSTVIVLATANCKVSLKRTVSGLIQDAALDTGADRLAIALGESAAARATSAQVRGLGSIQVWQLSTRLPYDALAAVPGEMRAVALSGDQVGALTSEGDLHIWNVRTPGVAPQSFHVMGAAGTSLRAVPVSNGNDGELDPRWLAVGIDGELRVVRPSAIPATGPPLISLPPLGYPGPVAPLALAVTPQRTLTLDPSGRLVTWDLDGVTALGDPFEPATRFDAVTMIADGTAIAISTDAVWSIPVPGRGEPVRVPIQAPSAVASRGNTWALGTSTGQVLAAHGSAGQLMVVGRHGAPVRAVAVLDGGAVASADETGNLQVVTSSGSLLRAELGVEVRSMASDGRQLYIGARSGAVLVLDSADLNRRRVLQAHSTDASAATVSADGKVLATGGDDRVIIVWDIAKDGLPTQRLRLVGQGDRITSLSFSPDDRWLASGGEDRNVILWDLQQGEQIGEPISLPVIPAVAFGAGAGASGSGGLELEVAAQGFARWPMRPQAWADIACHIINGRTLTDAERQRFLRGTSPAARCG